MAVPDSGDCDATGAHLDPFERGEMPPCNPDLPQTCQVGDLAGKHGAITSMPFRTTYADDFTAVSIQSHYSIPSADGYTLAPIIIHFESGKCTQG